MKKSVCGIYLIENKLTGAQYIGQSVDCWRRISEHCRRDKLLVDKAIAAGGVENFSFFIIKTCKKTLLDYWEAYYIYKFKTIENGYNEKINGKYFRHFKEMRG